MVKPNVVDGGDYSQHAAPGSETAPGFEAASSTARKRKAENSVKVKLTAIAVTISLSLVRACASSRVSSWCLLFGGVTTSVGGYVLDQCSTNMAFGLIYRFSRFERDAVCVLCISGSFWYQSDTRERCK